MDIIDDLYELIKQTEGEFKFKCRIGGRASKNAISPSQLKHVGAASNLKYMFDPQLAYKCEVISRTDYHKLLTENDTFANSPDAKVNCLIGHTLHALFEKDIKRFLEERYDVEVLVEFPVISRETAVYGSADLVVVDHKDKKIYLYDFKSTGPKILTVQDKHNVAYKRQLFAYAKSLTYIYEGYEVATASLIYVCKMPSTNSAIVEKKGKHYVFEADDDGHPIVLKCPLLRQVDYNYADLYRDFDGEFSQLTTLVIASLERFKERIPGWDHWMFNDDLYYKEIDKILGSQEKG